MIQPPPPWSRVGKALATSGLLVGAVIVGLGLGWYLESVWVILAPWATLLGAMFGLVVGSWLIIDKTKKDHD